MISEKRKEEILEYLNVVPINAAQFGWILNRLSSDRQARGKNGREAPSRGIVTAAETSSRITCHDAVARLEAMEWR